MTGKPIKRSAELAPLSREHHEGLLFVWKIRTGLKNGTSLEEMEDFSRWFWTNHLEDHFRKEEMILAQGLPQDNKHLSRMFEEHELIRQKITGINKDETKLEQLAALINDHIRFEERILFPELEKLIPALQLQKIQELLDREEKVCPDWPNSFWLKK